MRYLQPWKLATLAIGMLILFTGAAFDYAPDWDYGVSLLMGLSTYMMAPYVADVVREHRFGELPVAIVATWWCVDGSYWLYWSMVDPDALFMRPGQWLCSLGLFGLCAILWSQEKLDLRVGIA